MKKGMYKILVSISCLCLCMSFFIVDVKAEDNIYYPDPTSYTAYNFFFNHGYSHLILSSSTGITYNVDLDNNGTNNGSITGTDGLSGSSHNTGTINSNGSSTLGAKYMVCSTNNGTSASQTYSCYFSNRSNSISNSQSINIGFNENTYSNYNDVDINVSETIKQTIDTDITGQITSTTSSRQYSYLPFLKGSFTNESNFSNEAGFRLYKDNPVYLLFYTTDNISLANRQISFINNPYGTVGSPSYTWDAVFFGNLILNRIRFTDIDNEGNWYVPVINGINNRDVLPLYFGYLDQMPEDIITASGIGSSVSYIMNFGNKGTSNSVSDAENAYHDLSSNINDFDRIENNSVNDMNSKISNLNLTSDILSNSKFLSSAQWVKTQFDRMTVSTPIGSVLSFSLILGMTLIFLGKIK